MEEPLTDLRESSLDNNDGTNCFKMEIPDDAIGFIYDNKWYLHPAGNPDYPYDEVTGYTMGDLENLLKHIYGLSSLKDELKNNLPTGMTEKHIDLFLSYFDNLP